MRIYDLAKEIGQKLSLDVKPAKLAEEFNSLPEFAEHRDKKFLPSSSVDDSHADLMKQIYMARHGKQDAAKPATPAAGVRAAQPQPVRPQPATPPAPPRQPLPPRTAAPPPRPAPIQPPAGHRPTAPIPAVRRPAPIQAPGAKPAPPAEVPVAEVPPTPEVRPAEPPPVAKPAAPAPTHVAVAPTASHPAPSAPPAPPAAPAPPQPAAPRQTVAAPVRPQASQPPQARQGGAPPSQQRPGQPRQGEERRPQQPQQQQGGRPQQPLRGQKIRPGGLASELKSSSGTTGISAVPDSEKTAAHARALMARGAGQPAAPAAPKFSTDSPFVKPPAPPRRPESRPPSNRAEYPDRDRGPRPERPGEGRPDRGPRPERPGEGRPSDRGPRPDRPGDRPSRPGDRPQRPGEARPDRGPGAGRPGGRPEGAPGRGKKGPDEPLELTTVPEIGVMKLKPAKRRHGEKGRERPETAEEKKAKLAKLGKGAGKVVLKPSKVYGDADEFRRPLKSATRKPRQSLAPPERRAEPLPKALGPVILTGPVTVGAFAEKLNVPASDLIKRAFMKGRAITINQLMNFELAEEIAFDMEIDLQVQLESEETDVADYRIEDRPEDLKPRAPVVTIMGHVDHGKTTLLDYYRRSQVVEGEFGGITQHIGAYHVTTARGDIVFLDTPGHEAFTSMRARGAQCTDIVVLVVSADDGVMPQTIEAINHAKAAGVPMIVAVNKIDLPQANPEKVRNELLQYSVVPTSLGGETEFVEISAKKGINMDNLLEIISLQAEVMELKANPNRPAEGVVIESHIDPLRGAEATVLVRKGTLKVGSYFVVGQQYGRVRAMLDDRGKPMQEARPGQPCELIGLTGTPEVGELFLVMKNERKAREIAERREQRRRLLDLGTTRHVTLEGLHDMISEGQIKELNVILKADVQGSVEAIAQSLEKLGTQEIRIRVLHSGTGPINESDVNLAMASSAIIIGFNIRPESGASDLALREGVDIKLYKIIYELLEEIEKAMVGMLDKRFSEHISGRTEVRQLFRVSKVGAVAGCYVLSGEINRNAQCRLVRDGKVVYEGKVLSLRRVKDDVAKVAAGFECGVMLDKFQDVKEGDIIETYTLTEIPAELSRQA